MHFSLGQKFCEFELRTEVLKCEIELRTGRVLKREFELRTEEF